MAGGEPKQGVHPCLVIPSCLTHPICQKRRRIAAPLCRLPRPERRNHQEPVALLLLQEMLIPLSKAKYLTTLDIRGACNLVRMAEGEEWKTAFRTWYGLFESLVIPFGLTNAPADFQALINDVLRQFLDDFFTAFLDDILIYSNTLEEHKKQVYKVLKALADAGLHLKLEK